MWVQRVIVCLAAILMRMAYCATMEEVTLIGGDGNYINVRSDSLYALECNFRTGYDEPVSKVTWVKDTHRIVYVWDVDSDDATAYRELSGHVRMSGELKNLQFSQPIPLDISGNYSCQVSLPDEVIHSPPFSLVALDIPSDEFVTHVTLLSDDPNDQRNTTEDSNCTLSWDFKTPAIYPRPNVTCGYYSYLHDDVTSYLPAGLIMQRLVNGSWVASFDHTYVEIASIPRESRLGCSVSVPDTSYKRVVKFEDNFNIDHLIDAEGCPSVFLEPEYRLRVRLDGGTINCRGDLEQISSDQPITVTFSCNEGDIAIFPNGTAVSYWSKRMSCDSRQRTWVEQDENGNVINRRSGRSGQNITLVPTCVQWGNDSSMIHNSALLLATLLIAQSLLKL